MPATPRDHPDKRTHAQLTLAAGRVGGGGVERFLPDVQNQFIGGHRRKIRAEVHTLSDHIVLSAPLDERRKAEQIRQGTADPLLGDFCLMRSADFEVHGWSELGIFR